MLTMQPALAEYDIILINTSAGKDSQAMLDYVYALALQAGVTDRLVAVHCDLGRMEWAGTKELAIEQCSHYGVRLEIVSRPQGDLLTHVEQRGMWPSNTARFCTSDHKRGQVYRVMTKLAEEFRKAHGRQARILNCMGIRSEESHARAKRVPFTFDAKASNGRRHVDTWLPIFTWTVEQVWERIHTSGVRYHHAYTLGMPRLSCVFCIFAPEAALIIAGHHNRALLSEYVRVQESTGHKFRVDTDLVQIAAAVDAGVTPTTSHIVWKQCA